MNFIIPNWRVQNKIKAVTSKRSITVNNTIVDNFNLGANTADDPKLITQNRQLLIEQLKLPNKPHFLQQTHSTKVIELPNSDIDGDASYTEDKNQVCAILTADCLPVLFTDNRQAIAAAHAGWRGLCHGVLENTLTKFSCPKSDLVVWLGPAINQSYFEVGAEVRDKFMQYDQAASQAFIPSQQQTNKYYADLYLLAKQRLIAQGVLAENIYTQNLCTYRDAQDFFSYRREQGKTGRIASLIWFAQDEE